MKTLNGLTRLTLVLASRAVERNIDLRETSGAVFLKQFVDLFDAYTPKAVSKRLVPIGSIPLWTEKICQAFLSLNYSAIAPQQARSRCGWSF